METKMWEVSISTPYTKEYNGKTYNYKQNKILGVFASKVEEAIQIVQKNYPDGTVWAVHHRGSHVHKDGNIWERAGH